MLRLNRRIMWKMTVFCVILMICGLAYSIMKAESNALVNSPPEFEDKLPQQTKIEENQVEEKKEVLSEEEDKGVHPFEKIAHKIVHFDLKGAPPVVSYYVSLFPLLHKAGATGVLLEYEDMFPYEGVLSPIKSGYAYSKKDIEAILQAAKDNSLQVIPLIQTFGHMEFLLKHEQFRDLRENPKMLQSICPTNNRSSEILHLILDQIMALHGHLDAFHIGADEAYQVAHDERCKKMVKAKYGGKKLGLMLAHMTKVAKYLKQKYKIAHILAWNDMFEWAQVNLLKNMDMTRLIEPVIWGYAPDVQKPGYIANGMFDRYSKVFPRMWLGSAFKGANGATQTFLNIEKYLRNHESWLRLLWDKRELMNGRSVGIILTGWQRFDHFGSLCELLPVGIPSLITDLTYLTVFEQLAPKFKDKSFQEEKHLHFNDARKFRPLKMARFSTSTLYNRAAQLLKCDPTTVPFPENWEMYDQFEGSSFDDYADIPENRFLGCQFPGSKIYDLIWKLKIYREFYEKVMATSQVTNWLTDRQLSRVYGQVMFADQTLKQIEIMRKDLLQLGRELKEQLVIIYYEETVNEWLDDNIQKQLNSMKKLYNGCQKIVSKGVFQSRPLQLAKLEL